VRLGAPVGSNGDWELRGTHPADISSWILAGHATRAPAQHKLRRGVVIQQRYDGGNMLTRRDLPEGSRNVGTMYGFDTFMIAPALTVSYGSRYARYDFLEDRNLVSPRVEVTVTPAERMRISAGVSRTAQAPGAQEFLPPGDTGIWLPPQRTFSSIEPGRPLRAEHTTQLSVALERDLGGSTVSLRAFRQDVDDQLVTLFGADLPSQPTAKIGHYLVGNAGDVSAIGCTAAVRTVVASRVQGSIAYSLTKAQMRPADDLQYLVLLAPSALYRSNERIHDVATSIETNVPETSTRVLVLYRVSNGFVRPSQSPDRSGLGSRFDVQVRQSLPFLNFTSAKWEMLIAVRDFFSETTVDQSVYDELLVVRPPKRIVGGVTMHF
jgi:outer membrane receptor protein involved in Fe transport